MFHICIFRLYGLWGMLLVTLQSAVTWFLEMVDFSHCCSSSMSMPSSRCSGMPHGHSPISAVESHSQTLTRFVSLLVIQLAVKTDAYDDLVDLCVCLGRLNRLSQHCSALSTLRTRRCSLMPAGLSRTCPMEPMTKSNLWLTLVFFLVLWSFSCKCIFHVHLFPQLAWHMRDMLTPIIWFRHPSASVLIPALRTVGNIVTGDDLQTQVSSFECCFLFKIIPAVTSMIKAAIPGCFHW